MLCGAERKKMTDNKKERLDPSIKRDAEKEKEIRLKLRSECTSQPCDADCLKWCHKEG